MNPIDTQKNSLLHVSCRNSKVSKEIIEFLISKKSSLHHENSEKFNPFICSLNNKHITLETIKYFVEQKLDLKSHDKYSNFTSLHHLCANRNISTDILEYFVENKCDLNFENNKYASPFLLACENENISVETMKYFVEQKCGFNYKNKFVQNYPNHRICQNKNVSLEMMQFFVEQKSNLNLKEYTKNNALHVVCNNVRLYHDGES